MIPTCSCSSSMARTLPLLLRHRPSALAASASQFVLPATATSTSGAGPSSSPMAARQQIRTGANSAARIPASAGTSDAPYFKTFKPLTPSLRHVKMVVHPHLHKGKPVRDLTIAKRGTGGRNNTGHITTRFRGGGHKRRIRLVDFRRQAEGQQTVIRIEYDPGRTAHIALLEHDETGEQSYILAPEGLRFGAKVQSWPNGLQQQKQGEAQVATTPISTDPAAAQLVSNSVDRPADADFLTAHTATTSGASSSADATDAEGQPASLATSLLRTSMLQLGNQLPLHLIPPGTTIHCISTRPGGKASMCRSAGSSAKVVALTSAGPKGGQYAQIQLTSGEVRKLHHNCTATVGSVSNREHQNEVIGKAGRMRWLGRKPRNRGASMNAVDHPHGGGRGKSKGNKHPRTPQGLLTKGKRTRRPGPRGNTMVVRQRPRGPEKRGRK